MSFELSPDLLNDLIFGMENQQAQQVLDTKSLKLIEGRPELSDDVNYLLLPEWTSANGFELMESFVLGLHSPLLRERLWSILESGRGVFKNFKAALREEPALEQKWQRHKRLAMRSHILGWYNELRDYWGLLPIAAMEEEDGDTTELVKWDFSIRSADIEHIVSLTSLDKHYFQENLRQLDLSDLSQDGAEQLFLYFREGLAPPRPEQFIVCYTPDDEIAGFLWYQNRCGLNEILQLAVAEAYRGLGIAKSLMEQFHKKIAASTGQKIIVKLPSQPTWVAQSFEKQGFKSLGSIALF